MEPITSNNNIPISKDSHQYGQTAVTKNEMMSSSRPFIKANTKEIALSDIKEKHIIPVFIKDNEPVISHSDFIETTLDIVSELFHGETILKPNIRLSHPIKGRIPEARNKPAKELLTHEKTIYYERMAFIIEIPTIFEEIDGQTLSLTVGGIKAYNLDKLYSKKGADEHFKVFIGFQNKVCTNLCVWTDGYAANVAVKHPQQLQRAIHQLFSQYNAVRHIESLSSFTHYSLTEKQFANLTGRCRMYRYLPNMEREDIPPLRFGDSQINAICRDYYRNGSFCRQEDGTINLWKLYNLFTEANKSSYIDHFLDRSANAHQFCEELRMALGDPERCWFLN